jgi:hypothetical protein
MSQHRKEIVMYNPIIKTSIFAIALASIGLEGSASFAHPEMDAWGRDITSGPLPPIVDTQATAAGEITGSIKAAVECKQRNGMPCTIKKIRPKQRELPGDN